MSVIDLNYANAAALPRPVLRAPALPRVLVSLLAESMQVLKGGLTPTDRTAPEIHGALRRDLGLD